MVLLSVLFLGLLKPPIFKNLLANSLTAIKYGRLKCLKNLGYGHEVQYGKDRFYKPLF
jgi:hypothetical protein